MVTVNNVNNGEFFEKKTKREKEKKKPEIWREAWIDEISRIDQKKPKPVVTEIQHLFILILFSLIFFLFFPTALKLALISSSSASLEKKKLW